jgi:sulfate transport system permease protein
MLPALLTGFALAFARGVGEYGSVIFIAGNLPYVSGDRAAADRDQAGGIRLPGRHRDRGADACLLSFAILVRVNKLQRRLARGQAT